jgi:hypothetical protein
MRRRPARIPTRSCVPYANADTAARKVCIDRWEKKGYVLVETTQAIKNKARADERNEAVRSRTPPIDE